MKYITGHDIERSMGVESVYVDAVEVGDRIRVLVADRVSSLAASMDAIGIQQPITVYWDDGRCLLVAGRHRLAAAELLGWAQIPAVHTTADDIDRQLWEIDENLQRANLTPAQEADHLKRRKELWAARNNSGTNCPTITPGRPA